MEGWKCHFDSAVGAVSCADTDLLHVTPLLGDLDPVHHPRYHHYPHTNTNISVDTYLRPNRQHKVKQHLSGRMRDLNTSLKLKHLKNYSSALLGNLMAAAPHLCSALFPDQAFFSFFDVLMDLNQVYIYRDAPPLLQAAKWGKRR